MKIGYWKWEREGDSGGEEEDWGGGIINLKTSNVECHTCLPSPL